MLPWLEQRVRDGAIDAPTHNALGKIFVTLNKDPQGWLKTNSYYESKVVGKFCEKLDPFLAYLAYRRANGACDEELIEVTNKNGLWKDQARYLVERQDLALWDRVLKDENPHRRDLIDQVTSTALPESKNPDEVSQTVKAFMAVLKARKERIARRLQKAVRASLVVSRTQHDLMRLELDKLEEEAKAAKQRGCAVSIDHRRRMYQLQDDLEQRAKELVINGLTGE
jgi:hypothetical protein